MLTQEQVLEAVKSGSRGSGALDGRDFGRLVDFFPYAEWVHFGMSLKEGAKPPEGCKPWTQEAILEQLQRDVEFAFEKALNQRGLSAWSMHAVLLMWMWVLEDDLQHTHSSDESYAQYGLPLIKAVALKYGFPNEIGDDKGNEDKYAG